MLVRRSEEIATRPITQFASHAASVSHLARGAKVSVVRIELQAGGRLGMHPASRRQLFIVVAGEGTVLTDGGMPRDVAAGDTIWWEPNELHETRSEVGLTAIVVEADSLELAV